MSTPIENNTEELQNILQTVNNLPNLGGSGSGDVFVVRVTLDENFENVASVNKTSEEIAEAVNSGKACFAVIDVVGQVLPLSSYSPDSGHIAFGISVGTFVLTVTKTADEDWFFSINSIISSPHFLGTMYVPNNGEVNSFTISDADEVEEIGYHFDSGDAFDLDLILIDSETESQITRVSTIVKFSYIYGASDSYEFTRVFVKEGYFDVSVYYEYDSDDYIAGIRVEVSFTKTA
jgi:hypothetical protein